MAGITLTLKGADQIRANLSHLNDALQRRIVAASIRKAMNEELKPAVVAASPVGAKRKKARKSKSGITIGPIKKAWQTRLVKTATGVHMQLVPMTRTRDAFYARFLEFGWLAGRRITKGEQRFMRLGKMKARTRRPIAARPFAGPAAAGAFQKVADRTAAEIAGRIETEMKKVAR